MTADESSAVKGVMANKSVVVDTSSIMNYLGSSCELPGSGMLLEVKKVPDDHMQLSAAAMDCSVLAFPTHIPLCTEWLSCCVGEALPVGVGEEESPAPLLSFLARSM